MKRAHARWISLACLALIAGMLPLAAYGATDKEIDVSVDVAMERFVKEVKGAQEFLKAAKGVLILPKVMQAGFVVGGEYGEGALRVGGKTVDYWFLSLLYKAFPADAQALYQKWTDAKAANPPAVFDLTLVTRMQ